MPPPLTHETEAKRKLSPAARSRRIIAIFWWISHKLLLDGHKQRLDLEPRQP